MAYYPKSQIITDLNTDGTEYFIQSTGQSYKGSFYKTSTGEAYTGKNPKDGENLLLEKFSESSLTAGNVDNGKPKNVITSLDVPTEAYIDVVEDFTLNVTYNPPQEFPDRQIPTQKITLPTPKDYNNGRMVRYFAKKTNELKYREVSKSTYESLRNRNDNIAWDLYESLSLIWVIEGPKNMAENNNKSTIKQIENKNKWHGFSKFLKEDYTKYLGK